MFVFWLLCFLIHNNAVTLFRMIGAWARSLVVANAIGALALLVLLLLGGFVLTKQFVHPWSAAQTSLFLCDCCADTCLQDLKAVSLLGTVC